ncbi:Hypothetical predicted protein [Paramuricea clavata]|uniref:P2X purinoreceptor 7 intracellular domain-containing protein n=1 Tax=Paramuricea clavata TaxID=317549 RepID=A0A6S7IAT3_PARCT|nr:Hypothetical predicted protein [Paramuricea clavata]
MEETSFTLEQQDEDDLMQASETPFHAEQTTDSGASDESFQPPQRKRSRVRGQSNQHRAGCSSTSRGTRASGGETTTSRGTSRRGRGCGRLLAEENSEERQAQHEEQILELINGLNEETVGHLAVELLRRQPAVFADLVNGELPNNVNTDTPGETGPPESSHSPDWCKCGLCVAMPTQAENKCCTQVVRECITIDPLFHQIVLDRNI